MRYFFKQIARIVAVVCAVVLFTTASSASAEVINSFSADIKINQDASVSITEEIQYDFEEASRHGIYREVPIRYETDVGNRRIFIDNISVLQDGGEAQWQTSRSDGNLRIRIGDPDVTISGAHTYTISYDVRGALNFFEAGNAELYWDVVGSEWEVPIRQAQADVWLANSGSLTTSDLTIRCFAGPVGTAETCQQLSTTTNPLGLTATAVDIEADQAMTAVLNFPARVVEKPAALASIWWFIQANLLVLLPLLTLIISFFAWWRWGKDPEGRGVIVPQYEPPENLKPILVGSLVDDTVHTRDITAGIIYLAEQGFITIEREEKQWLLGSHDYILHREKSLNDISDHTYQHLAKLLFNAGSSTNILSLMFKENNDSANDNGSHKDSVRLSELKKSEAFRLAIQKLKKDVMQDMRDRGWFVPKNNIVGGLFGVIILLGVVLLMLSSGSIGIVGSGSIAVTITIVSLFSGIMKKKTKAGAILQEKLLGFKEFLSMTQKERLDFHNAPERKPKEFMEYLPYAVALEVEEKWAKQFEGIDIPPPSWYHGSGHFAAASFASDLSSFSEDYSQAASGGSGTSGGGAGGGMGGGGGGSW